MSERYQCRCGIKLSIRRLVKDGATVCPACKRGLPHKSLAQRYNKLTERKFILNCLCGETYRIPPPSGSFQFQCQKCGRILLSILPRDFGINPPRFPEAVGTANEANK